MCLLSGNNGFKSPSSTGLASYFNFEKCDAWPAGPHAWAIDLPVNINAFGGWVTYSSMMDETFYKANQLVILPGIPGFESAGRRNPMFYSRHRLSWEVA